MKQKLIRLESLPQTRLFWSKYD